MISLIDKKIEVACLMVNILAVLIVHVPVNSSYSVIVQMVESDHLGLDKSNGNMVSHQLTWPQLCGVSRVSGHAAKVLYLFSLISLKH